MKQRRVSRRSLTLADIQARPRHEVDFTLECSGNHGIGLDFFIGGIGNARWGGARLAPLLEEAGIQKAHEARPSRKEG